MPLLLLSFGAIAAVIARPQRTVPVRLLCIALAFAGLFAPVFVAKPGPVRTLLAFAMVMGLFRTIQMLREEHPLRVRVLSTLLFVDLQAQSKTSHGAWFLVVRTLVLGAVSAVSLVYVERAPLMIGALYVVSSATVVDGIARLIGFAFGQSWGAFHDDPWLSRSLAEFWGKRWNRIVSHWLKSHVYVPAASRTGPVGGVFATFLASAALHFYPTLVSTDLRNACMMGAYFLLQAVLVLVEKSLPDGRWKRPYAFAALLGPLPLFIFPLLRSLGFPV
ncbi:MAG: MBOAT family protein [Polyangiaceae bacterium]